MASEALLASLLTTFEKMLDLAGFLEKPDAAEFAVPVTRLASGAGDFKVEKAGHGPFDLDVAIVPLATRGDREELARSLEALFGTGKAEDFIVYPVIAAGGGLRILPLICPKSADVKVFDKEDPFDTAESRNLRYTAIAEYRPLLEMLARISGRKIVFHAEGGAIRPPYPADGAIHIMTNAMPPGAISVRYANLAFGMKIGEDGLSYLANGPTKGRGVVLTDEYKEPLVQVLGDNWYLLIPTLSHYNTTSVRIFERLLGLAWNAMREGKTAIAPPEALTKRAFTQAASAWTTDMDKVFDDTLRTNDDRIQKLQKELAEAIRTRKEWLNLKETYSKGPFIKETCKRLPKDFAAIAGQPEVARLSIVDDGLHVETKPLVAEHGGKRYALGAFVIRVGRRGSVSVWSENPTHPKGIPHPHIAKDGGPCYGNASDAIVQAAGEMRLADAVRYVLRWLTEGYTEKLAAVKIEEWPLVKTGGYAATIEGGMAALDDSRAALDKSMLDAGSVGTPQPVAARSVDANTGGMP